MKKSVPRTNPCGTPHFTDLRSDLAPLYITNWDRSLR